MHELSHYIVGLLMGAKPTNFSVIPNKKQGSAGHVTFRRINFINALPIALAPLFGGVFGFWFLYLNYYVKMDTLQVWEMILSGYLGITFFKTMLPSDTDLKVAFSYPLGVLMYGGIIYFYQ